MTHSEARELLELAAAEPDGFDRLAAGDTTDAGALAGHLAGCDACREEYARLARTARLLRTSLATLPPPDLRERTLARVAHEGRLRAPASAAATTASAPTPAVPSLGAQVAAPVATGGWRKPTPTTAIDRRLAVGWLGSLAAAIAVAVALSWAVVARPLADQASRDRQTTDGLAQLVAATVAVDVRPDARHVALSSTTGGAAGMLAFAPSMRQLVVISTGLAMPPAGSEYRCWMETNGRRTPLGRMYFVGTIAAWEGEVDAIAGVPAGARFGVSLAAGGGAGAATDGQPVLTGTLGGT